MSDDPHPGAAARATHNNTIPTQKKSVRGESGILWRLRKPVVRRGEQVQELCEVGLERDAVVGEREVVLVVTKGHLV